MQIVKTPLRNLFFAVATFLCAAHLSYAQGVDTTVQNPFLPTGNALINSGPDADGNLTLGGEYKQPKNVVEQEKPVCWTWYADIGYTSEYNFRGTNLTPDADGAGFISADVSKWGFTLGVYEIYQFGTAHNSSWAISEGGGAGNISTFGGGVNNFFPAIPTTKQNFFNEIDFFLQYNRDIGPISVTVGDIGFFIDRRAETFVNAPTGFTLPGPPFGIGSAGTYGPFRTVEDEQFDRVFIRLATSKIPYVEPWITYYQTIYDQGQDPFHHMAFKEGPNPFGYFIFYNGHERNPEQYGGYLEGRLRGHFPITHWLDFNPFGVISYSFGDRSEPVSNPTSFEETLRGRPLRGWNVAQVGLELPIHLFHVVGTSSGHCAPPDFHGSLVPFMTYSYHISEPTSGTDRNEVFGGAKFAITF